MRPPLPPLRHRATALLAAFCVLVLGLASVNPQLHAWLHGNAAHETDAACATAHAHGDDAVPVSAADHECVVTLFASGVVPLLLCLLLVLGLVRLGAGVVWAGELLAAAYPRFRLVPSHAPPTV